MSYNFLFNNIDTISKKHPNKTDFYQKTLEKNLEKIKKTSIKNIKKDLNTSQNKKSLVSLEKTDPNSLILLEILKKQNEKNLFKKYLLQDVLSLEENNQKITNNTDNSTVKNILMKKKFLITTLLNILSIKQ